MLEKQINEFIDYCKAISANDGWIVATICYYWK